MVAINGKAKVVKDENLYSYPKYATSMMFLLYPKLKDAPYQKGYLSSFTYRDKKNGVSFLEKLYATYMSMTMDLECKASSFPRVGLSMTNRKQHQGVVWFKHGYSSFANC